MSLQFPTIRTPVLFMFLCFFHMRGMTIKTIERRIRDSVPKSGDKPTKSQKSRSRAQSPCDLTPIILSRLKNIILMAIVNLTSNLVISFLAIPTTLINCSSQKLRDFQLFHTTHSNFFPTEKLRCLVTVLFTPGRPVMRRVDQRLRNNHFASPF
jgi:hypothetical protein